MDFDVKQRRTQEEANTQFGEHVFTLRGEQFSIRRIVPFKTLQRIAEINSESSDADALYATYGSIMDMLSNDDQRERFQTLLDDSTSEFPVTYGDLLEVRNWMIAEAAGRPPTQPVSSSDSPSTNGSNETASSSPAPDAR